MDPKTAVFFLLSVCTAIFGYFVRTLIRDIFNFLWLKRNGVMTEGTIVDVKEMKYDDVVYNPIIEFETEDRTKVRFTSVDSSSRMPQIGEQLIILYDKSNPARAEKYESKMFWTPFLIVLFISSFFIFFWIKFFTAKTFTWRDSSMDCILPLRSLLF